MSPSRRLWLAIAVAAAALVVGANWHLVAVALQSQPGCVAVAQDMPAAKPGC